MVVVIGPRWVIHIWWVYKFIAIDCGFGSIFGFVRLALCFLDRVRCVSDGPAKNTFRSAHRGCCCLGRLCFNHLELTWRVRVNYGQFVVCQKMPLHNLWTALVCSLEFVWNLCQFQSSVCARLSRYGTKLMAVGHLSEICTPRCWFCHLVESSSCGTVSLGKASVYILVASWFVSG